MWGAWTLTTPRRRRTSSSVLTAALDPGRMSTSLLLSVRWLNVVTSFNSQIVGLMLARALSFFGFKMYLPLKSQMCSLFIGCHFDLNLSQPCI